MLKNVYSRFMIKKLMELDKKSQDKSMIKISDRTKENAKIITLEEGKSRKRFKIN